MLDKIFGTPLHENADPAQRVVGVATLPRDSKAVVQLLGADPSPDVRAAAALHCNDPAALAHALRTETEKGVRGAITASLGKVAATTSDAALAQNILAASECSDDVRAQVALHAEDEERRRIALDGIADEDVLVDVALAAEHASVRSAAAERVRTIEPLRRLLKGARDKDRGVARLARERLDTINQRIVHAAAADAILEEAEALVVRPGPIVMAAVELDRRWKALALGEEADRRTRWEAIGRRMQEHFDRELEEQRAAESSRSA